MLTRLEVDGFKNLVDFSLDFGPYTCIAGPYGVGKSNVFDAVNFLSLLARYPINEAALRIGNAGEAVGDVANLFSFARGERATRMKFGVEMIVDRAARDDAGRVAGPSSSFLRYELAFRYEHGIVAGGMMGGLVLEREELRPIIEARAGRHLKFHHSKSKFRDAAVFNNRHAKTGFISTDTGADAASTVVTVHQDGGFHGRGGPSPTSGASRTIIGTENTAATPTILAAKREMQNWLVLTPDPVAMRKPDPFYQPAGISSDGSHMPATLRHMSNIAMQNGWSSDAFARAIPELLSEIVALKSVGVVEDQARRLLMLELEEPSGLKLPAQLVPEGTLRHLLLGVLARQRTRAVICLEEPENGIHPAKLAEVDRLLHEMAVDPDEPVDSDNPMRQIIVTTHSPFLVQLQRAEDLVLAKTREAAPSREDPPDNLLECIPCEGTWRSSNEGHGIGLLALLAYLMPVETAQIALPRRFWT